MPPANVTKASPIKDHRIEEGQRLSQSLLWQYQREYYTHQGMAAWREGDVPYYITSNPSIAKAYAHLIFGWLRDLTASRDHPLELSQPIYVVELGAGSGKFAYHFLKYLLPLLEASALKHLPFCYVMSDFAPTVVEAWQAQPQLAQFTSAGKLDFALFDVTHDQTLTLINSGDTLAPTTLANPLAVIANYLFDSLSNDVFRIENEQLYECLVTLSSQNTEQETKQKPEVLWTDPKAFKQFQIAYRHQPVVGQAYDDPAFSQLLQSYAQALKETHLLFPIGALECLRLLRQLSNDRLFLIAGDKGNHLLSDLEYRLEPGIAVHGSFSMSVNFHALGQYTLNQGGTFLSTPHRHAGLNICAFLFDAKASMTVPDVAQTDTQSYAQIYIETQQAYHLAIIQGGPDDLYSLKKAVETHYEGMEIPQLLAYLRLSGWDSNIFTGCFVVMIKKLPGTTAELKAEVDSAIQHVWENYYYLGEEKDIAFALGLTSLGTENHTEAIIFFQNSLILHGPDSSSYYYLALSYYRLGALEQALDSVRASIAINPDFEPAQTLEWQIQFELAEGIPASPSPSIASPPYKNLR